MYISYCGNKDVYTIFVTKNLSRILTYLKHQTKSYELFVDFKNNAIHVSYILPLCEVRTSNEQSVSRLKCICKTLLIPPLILFGKSIRRVSCIIGFSITLTSRRTNTKTAAKFCALSNPKHHPFHYAPTTPAVRRPLSF